MKMLGFCLLTLCLVSSVRGLPGAILSEYQDSLGQYSFGYSSPESARSEVRSADGKTRGAFSFVDASGIIQTARYTADSESGFRIEATYLPEAPQPVQDTPEVIAAREDHLKAIAEAEKMQQVEVAMKNSENMMIKISEENEEKGRDIKDDKEIMMEDNKGEQSHENHQPAFVKTSFVMPANNLNLQSRIELQPLEQASSASQGIQRENLGGASSAAIVSASTGYSPYSSIFISPYTAINRYPHYRYVPTITHIY